MLVPFDVFRKIRPLLENEAVRNAIPHEIVRLNALEGVSMIKAWREYLGMKINELAAKVGISGAYLSQIESGKRNPTIETLKNIAKALDVEVEILI